MTTNNQTITLNQFLKLAGIAQTGGQAKMMIQSGAVQVNGTVDTRRGRKLETGDLVTVESQTFEVDVSQW